MLIAGLMASAYFVSLHELGNVMGAHASIFAFGLVAFGFLCMGPVNIAVDSYGPVTDNAQSIFELAQTGEIDRGFIKLDKSLTISLKLADEAFKRDSHVTGVTTGLRDMDRKLGGFQKSDLIILAGRPSMGKTALATNMAMNAARAFHETGGKEGSAVAFFSLEMSSEQLSTRLLGDYSSVPADKIRRGEIKQEDFQKFMETSKYLSHAPLYIDDTPGLTVASLRTRARRLKRLVPSLGMIVIDYLQLLHGSAKNGDNRVQEVSEITRGLKGLAKTGRMQLAGLSSQRGDDTGVEKIILG